MTTPSLMLHDFDYDLPESFIAQTPIEPRDASRLLVLDRHSGAVEHRVFRDIIDFINPGDVLVINTTRVIPARLHATKTATGGRVEILLLRQLDEAQWLGLVGGRRVDVGTRLHFDDPALSAEVIEVRHDSERVIAFSQPIQPFLATLGEMPLPPYIQKRIDDPERYQTVYNHPAQTGSAAAPTAGLHFTPDLMLSLRAKGVLFAECTLHVGLGTFQPVKTERLADHVMHYEQARLSADDANMINRAKLAGARVIAVGTTAARTLETAGILSEGGDPSHPDAPLEACPWRPVVAFERDTNLFITPGYRWRVVDALITNFHLPKSTLLMMISALAGRENVLNAYEIAKREGYRFFSFGDAMFIR